MQNTDTTIVPPTIITIDVDFIPGKRVDKRIVCFNGKLSHIIRYYHATGRRTLQEIELLPIQGFPPDYIEKVRAMGIKVSGTNAKKYIGNSQEVTTAKCLVEAYGDLLCPDTKQVKKAA